MRIMPDEPGLTIRISDSPTLEDLDLPRMFLAQGFTEIRSGLVAFNRFEGGKDFGFRLFEAAWFGVLAGSDFHEVPPEPGANEGGFVGG